MSIGSGTTLQLNSNKTSGGSLTVSNAFTGDGLLNLNFTEGTTSRYTYLTGLSGFAGTIQLSKAAGISTTRDKFEAVNLGTINAALIINSDTTYYNQSGTTTFSNGITISGNGNSENRITIRLRGTLGGNPKRHLDAVTTANRKSSLIRM